jgi:intracellular sulfur oxidation DsrE/DsrF family protein
MKQAEDIDDLMINSFVDGQLDAVNCEAVLAAMEIDPDIRQRVYRTRRAKDLMKVGFGNAETPSPARSRGRRCLPGVRSSYGLAASLLMVSLGFGSGVLGFYVSKQLSNEGRTVALASLQVSSSDHVILHISESDPKQFAAALRYVDNFLDNNPLPASQIEVVANAGGLDLMRADTSPFKEQIVAMMRNHENVHFIACLNGIRNLRRRGIEPKFIGDIDTDKTAIDHIINRLQAGWTYIKVDDLPEI